MTVAVVKSQATIVKGQLGGVSVDLMLDSGSSVSLVQCDILSSTKNIVDIPQARPLRLVTASGDQLPILGQIRAKVQLGEFDVFHDFVVVKKLVTSVILGIDFLQQNGLILDFNQTPVAVRKTPPDPLPSIDPVAMSQVIPIYEDVCQNQAHVCMVQPLVTEPEVDIVDECAIPNYKNSSEFELPKCTDSQLKCLLEDYKEVFCTTPGVTDCTHHYIPTVGNPIKVPPRRVPAHYRNEVSQQIQTMLELGIIVRSKSPWMAPAVFVPKKSGQLRICVDYRELNKRATKDSYPLPLPDEVQDRLAGSTIFSTLDLHSGYWQLPVNITDGRK